MTRAELERNAAEAERLAGRWAEKVTEAQSWRAHWLREAESCRAAIRRLERERAS